MDTEKRSQWVAQKLHRFQKQVHTRVSDLYSKPYDQLAEQLRLTIEAIKGRQETELINNAT